MLALRDGTIKVTNGSFSYGSVGYILKGVDLFIDKGDFVFIRGASGSGKTSLIKSFYGAMHQSSGDVIVNGNDIKSLTKNALYDLRRDLGVVFQDFKLIQELTVKENVSMPLILEKMEKREIDSSVEKLLKYVDILYRQNAYPNEISGGEQQRAAFARALVNNPDIILADEPTGNLDEKSSAIVYELLAAANQSGKTVVVATHHMPEYFKVDYRELYIENGELQEI